MFDPNHIEKQRREQVIRIAVKTIATFILLIALDCRAGLGGPASPPSVVIESVVIDGQTNLLSGPSPSINVLPGQKQVQIHFASPNIAVPAQGHYLYRLDGLDANWVEASRTIATYNSLPAGRYRFMVEAVGTNGTTIGTCSSMIITVASLGLPLPMLGILLLLVIVIFWMAIISRRPQ